MPSKRYFLSRTGQAILSFWAALTLTFALLRLMPGSPVDAIRSRIRQANPGMSRQEINEIVQSYVSLNPSEPLYIQYIDYITNVLTGDLGMTTLGNEPVAGIVARAMPWTIFLSAASLMFIYLIGITLGAVMGYTEGSRFDFSMTGLGIFLASIPYYILAALMIWWLAFEAELFPWQGRYSEGVTPGFTVEFIIDALHHAVLPVASLVITGFGLLALGMRGNSVRILGEDYLRVARLRALSERRIALRYVGRNAILPLYTSMMISIGTLFGGSIILEQLFAYPGMGYYMFNAVQQRDYPTLMGGFLFITFGVIVGIYIADLTYGFVDPRAGTGSRQETYGGARSSLSLSAAVQWIRRLWKEPEAASDQPDSGADPRTPEADSDSESPFNAVSDLERTQRERYVESFEEWLLGSLRVMWSDWRARVGGTIILIYLLAGTAGVVLIERPVVFAGPDLQGAFQTMEFPLGTDNQGRGILAQLVHATPAMLKMMAGGAFFAAGVGTLWGTFSGFVGGRVDRVMMTLSDIIMTIPGLPLVIVLAITLEPKNPFVVGILLSVNGWAGLSRSLRSQVLTIRQESYVEASRTMGLSTGRVLRRDIIPNLMPLIIVNFVMRARGVIFSSVGLYFLGILPFSTLNWGVMLNFAYKSPQGLYSMRGAHWVLSPMLTILLITLGLILFGQAADRLFNPRIRARHEDTSHLEEGEEGPQVRPGTAD